ncbi:uncharacterized protein LOC111120062 isoform X2 [Crassostrea virginica]
MIETTSCYSIVTGSTMANVLRIIFIQILLCSFSVSAPSSNRKIPTIESLEKKNCDFPPANLYIGHGKGHSLVNCTKEKSVKEETQALGLDLCKIFWESLNNDTCYFDGISDFKKETSDSEVQQYCDKTLKKVFDDAGSKLNCTTLCTKNKFAKELCTLIHFATNITLEKSSQQRTNTDKGTDTSPPPAKKVLSSTKQTQLNTTTTKPNKNTTPTKPNEDATTTKPNEDATTTKPNEDATTTKPNEDATTTKPNEDATPTKPNEDATTTKPNEDATTTKPNEDATTTKPNEDATTTKPNEDATTTKPNEDATPTKPNEDATTTKPNEDATTTKPNEDATTTKPIEDATTTKPNEDATTAKPNEDATTAKPNTIIAKLNNTNTTKPNKNATSTKPNNTTTSKTVPSTPKPINLKTTTLNQENIESVQQEHRGPEQPENEGSEQQQNNPSEQQENNGSEQQQNNPSEQQENNGSEQQQNNPSEQQENNGSEQQNQGSKQQGGRRTEYKDPSPEPESEGHFMAYFLTAVVLCVAGYVIFHNKQKIVAFIVEGRTGRRSSRRSNKGGYSKLKPSVDDVMPSLEKSTKSTTYVY